MCKGVSIIFNGPFNPAPLDFFSNLQKYNFFPIASQDINVLSLAVRARVLATVVPDASKYTNLIKVAA
eukprot:1513198-Karenia_brevis.AAC.1